MGLYSRSTRACAVVPFPIEGSAEGRGINNDDCNLLRVSPMGHSGLRWRKVGSRRFVDPRNKESEWSRKRALNPPEDRSEQMLPREKTVGQREGSSGEGRLGTHPPPQTNTSD